MPRLRTFSFLLLAGCAGGANASAPAALVPAPTPSDSPALSAVQMETDAGRSDAATRALLAAGDAPAAATTSASAPPIRIVVEEAKGYEGTARAAKLREAVAMAEKVLNDTEFGQVMRAYPGIHGLAGFSQPTLYGGGSFTSSDQPMTDLLRGNSSDGEIHLWLEIDSHGGEDGHTVQNPQHTGVTFSKGSIVDQMTVAQLADHLVHEHMHRIGFQHARSRSLERCDSVPYAFGRTVCQFAIEKYASPGTCDLPVDWPPEEPRKHPEPGPRC
jgi:hypothetical protein